MSLNVLQTTYNLVFNEAPRRGCHLPGHGTERLVSMQEHPTVKLCECGCGEPAPIAQWSNTRNGWVKRQPKRFVHGHNARPSPDEQLALLWSKVEKADGCWMWVGYLDRSTGYGRLSFAGAKSALAHRVVYELVVGPIPEGLTLDHLCRNRACVNPAHLEPVTRRENVRRGLTGVLRTHCKHGHEFTAENTYVIPSTGHRVCRRCKRLRDAAYKARTR